MKNSLLIAIGAILITSSALPASAKSHTSQDSTAQSSSHKRKLALKDQVFEGGRKQTKVQKDDDYSHSSADDLIAG